MAARMRIFPVSQSRDGFRERTEATLPLCKAIQRLIKLFSGEIRPERVDKHQLGIGRLPEQKVAQSMFAASADDEVGLGKCACEQSGREELRRDRLWIQATFLGGS